MPRRSDYPPALIHLADLYDKAGFKCPEVAADAKLWGKPYAEGHLDIANIDVGPPHTWYPKKEASWVRAMRRRYRYGAPGKR